MLNQLINNKEDSRILLIEDTMQFTGQGLLRSFIQNIALRVDEVHLMSYDFPPELMMPHTDHVAKQRIVSHDLFTDAHGWNGEVVSLNLDLAAQVSDRINVGVETIAIVFLSLSPLLLHKTSQDTCKTINSLAHRDIKKGVTVKHVVGLVHRDLHDPSTMTKLEHTATTILTLDQPENAHFTGTCHITQKKGSGKITKKKEYFTLDDRCHLSHSQEASGFIAAEQLSAEDKEPDPAANLTFNLRLTGDEKMARSQLKLPYTYHEKKKEQLLGNTQETGKIFYHPDVEDDFDEDDPDDDLDV